ncbi:carotenoid isomerooxygenase isoform X2 [Athalia rosae]|uniref:carotenoid isomerooxygenase isoform X2 n=1 Tax=Athalia rosae TaxID=37344 RepID=UPI00203412FD|nr:carotenoid isomerooxygenase isoform X2 [Athalia rosae]
MDKKLKGRDEDADPRYWPNCDTSVWLRSCEEEVLEPITGKNFGTFPHWLNGVLLRNGPGSLNVGDYNFEHLFDSSALLHRFAINDGRVTYQRRFVQTDVYKRNRAAQRIVFTEFGTKAVPDPCQCIFSRVASIFNIEKSMADNSMISIYPFGDEFYAFTEAPFMHRIDPETLETKDKIFISRHVALVNHTSHPHVMNDGSIFNLGLKVTARGLAYGVVRFSTDREAAGDSEDPEKRSIFDRAKLVATVNARWSCNPSYMHSFGVTDNYFVIVEQPLSISIFTLVACRLKNEPMSSCLKWYDKENTLIHLVSRKTGTKVKTFVAEAFFYLHIINQFETKDGKNVVLDICCYRDAKMLDCMYVEVMKNAHKNPNYAEMFRGRPLRFILPVESTSDEISEEINLVGGQLFRRSEKVEKNEGDEEAESFPVETENLLKKGAAAYRLPDGNIFVKPELLCDLGCETPRINSEFNLGKEYRYFYAISSDVDLEIPGTLIKVDTVTKTRKIWCEKNVYPSEPIFVPNPEGTREDDGVVISALVWGENRETEVGFLVLDGTTFEEIARSTFETPGPVPKCLHGWFDLKK